MSYAIRPMILAMSGLITATEEQQRYPQISASVSNGALHLEFIVYAWGVWHLKVQVARQRTWHAFYISRRLVGCYCNGASICLLNCTAP
jgi:hypothetical protein